MPVVELKQVCKAFHQLVVLDKLDLVVPDGQSLVIIGASGTGKSVLLKHIVALMTPDAGEVHFDGARIDNLSERKLVDVRKRFGFLFQMGALFDSLTVLDNVAFPLTEHTKTPRDKIRRIVEAKLEMVGMAGAMSKMPAQLSGGQRKRVALARAIALDPEVILYDEPTTGLDPIRADTINDLILKLKRQLKVTSIVVTHDMASALKIADRIVMLHEGKMRFDGSPTDARMSTDPIVRRFVTGEAQGMDDEAVA